MSSSTAKYTGIQNSNRQVLQRRVQADRRNSPRRKLTVPVRFMFDDKLEYKGMLQNISAGGLLVEAEVLPCLGDMIIIYIDGIGRFEGIVLRTDDTSFAIKMDLSELKINRLEASLNAYFAQEKPNAEYLTRRTGSADRRASPRMIGDETETIIGKKQNGKPFQCSVCNLSLCGIEIKTTTELDLGDYVTVGKVHACVSRKTELGYVLIHD